jgi:hypothetical protein
MKTLKTITKTLAMLCLVGFTQWASAGLISFDPTPALGNVGDSISVDLVWTGDPGEYLGDWDVEVFFDSTIADIANIVFDPDNGVDSLGSGIYDSGPIAGGLYALAISLDTVGDLMTNQDSLGNTFRLATLEFSGVSNGQTSLTFGTTTFGDESGNAISPTLSNGQICVGPDGCRIIDTPEPASVLLFSLALAGLGFFRRNNA